VRCSKQDGGSRFRSSCAHELRNSGKTLRYRLLHVAARITYGQRKLFLRLAEHCPWALALAKAFTRLRQIPLPA